ncbi:MAG: ATP-binding protein, partial [Candidatus Methanomethylophilaceae archaeon]|nr:ATP-binding protein [Candidatus Methanomethylophilaceae archaeon]
MEIARDRYLQRLIVRKHNGKPKIITGIRRCGKSYLLLTLFRNHLISDGVPEENIISVSLEEAANKPLRDPVSLTEYVRERAAGKDECYVLLDEIQMVEDFEDVVNTLIKDRNLDVYITGSNSKFLSSDVRSKFRGRGDRVHVQPLSFSEFSSVYKGDDAWKEYARFGGMPETMNMQTPEQKIVYLKDLMDHVYKKDMIERYDIRKPDELSQIIDSLSSSIGSLTNPMNISNTLRSEYRSSVTDDTVNRYMEILEESYLFEKAKRYDIKGRKGIGSPMKNYITDIGLSNAQLNFREMDMSHIMENIVYNELRSRGYVVDVGVVEIRPSVDGRREAVKLEVDFVANKGDRRYYIQSAYMIPDENKREQETRVFSKIGDDFR